MDRTEGTRVEALCQSVMAVNESVKALKASFESLIDSLFISP